MRFIFIYHLTFLLTSNYISIFHFSSLFISFCCFTNHNSMKISILKNWNLFMSPFSLWSGMLYGIIFLTLSSQLSRPVPLLNITKIQQKRKRKNFIELLFSFLLRLKWWGKTRLKSFEGVDHKWCRSIRCQLMWDTPWIILLYASHEAWEQRVLKFHIYTLHHL